MSATERGLRYAPKGASGILDLVRGYKHSAPTGPGKSPLPIRLASLLCQGMFHQIPRVTIKSWN